MMIEYDLVLMSLCIFVPSAFALGLLFFPKGSEEAMRWWSLVGTAATFVLSTFVFVDYHAYLGQNVDQDMAKSTNDAVLRPHKRTTLQERAQAAAEADYKNRPRIDRDMHSRNPWIARFNI